MQIDQLTMEKIITLLAAHALLFFCPHSCILFGHIISQMMGVSGCTEQEQRFPWMFHRNEVRMLKMCHISESDNKKDRKIILCLDYNDWTGYYSFCKQKLTSFSHSDLSALHLKHRNTYLCQIPTVLQNNFLSKADGISE